MIREIEIDGESIDQEEDISDAFNEFFSNVALDLDGNIPFSNVSPYRYVKRNPNTMFLKPTSPITEVENMGLKLLDLVLIPFPQSSISN